MEKLLAPLVGDAKTVSFIGLCKNAGKTTAMNRLLAEWEREHLAVTSIGRDGESRDVVTGTQKPEIFLREGTLFATARGMLPLCDVTVQVEGVTDVHTPLGQVAVFRAMSSGRVQLAGPSSVEQLAALREEFFALGADRVILDGAAGRKSLAAAGEDGCAVLCVGASMEGGLNAIAAETAHVCALFDAPQVNLGRSERFALLDCAGEILAHGEDRESLLGALPAEGGTLWAAGGVTSPMVRALGRKGAPVRIAAPDATHFLFDRDAAQLFYRAGGTLAVERKLKITAVCANPWSARGDHLEKQALLAALREVVNIPVVDGKEGWT